jgi:hypothetical protein
MWTGPLFVVGAPRSGTKLLRDLLKQHPRLGIPDFETEFLPRFEQQQGKWDLATDDGWAAFYAWATRFMYFKYMDEQGRLISSDAWRAACPEPTLQGAFEGLCRHDAAVPADGVWGDKSPNYRNNLPQIRALWPHARFVHIVRDVRDVVLSSQNAWGKDPVRNAQRWMDEVGACRRWGRSFGDAYLELRYEDLIVDPEPHLRAIAAHCGLDFDPAMLRPDRPSENLGDTAGQVGIVAGNTEKWRTRMEPALLQRVEAVCGPLLAELGYPLGLPPQGVQRVSAGEMQARKLADGVNLLRFRVRDWGWRDAVKYSISAFESTLADR